MQERFFSLHVLTMGKVRSWDFRFHEGRIACMLDLHGLLTNEFVRMLAQCCPTVACFRNGFTAGCSQAGELFYQLVREGAHTLVRKGKVVCKPVTVKRRTSALEFGLTFLVTYSRTLGVSLLTLKSISCLRAKDVAAPSCSRADPVPLQACRKKQLDEGSFCFCHGLSEVPCPLGKKSSCEVETWGKVCVSWKIVTLLYFCCYFI